MRLHPQKASRTGYGTAFVGLRNPILHFALATGFLALQPVMDRYGVDNSAAIGNGPFALAGRIKSVMDKVAVPSPTRKVGGVRIPAKVHRSGPSSTTASSRSASSGHAAIISASLVSVVVGAALALEGGNTQGHPSAGEDSSRDGGDHATGGDSGDNGLGEFHLLSSSPISDLAFTVGEESPPPGDNPNDPSEAGNGAGVFSKSSMSYKRDCGGSPPPPPPPSSGTGVDDDNSRPSSSTFGPVTLLVLLSYLLCKRALDYQKKKESETSQAREGTPSSSSSTVNLSSDASLSLFNVTPPLIVDIQRPVDPFEDFFGNESVHFGSFDIAPILEIALSATPPSAPVEFWDADATRRVPVAVYEPMPTSPNVLLSHRNTTCSADDKPAPSPTFIFEIMDALFTFFAVFFGGMVVYLLGYVTCFEFTSDAAPEGMDQVEFSRLRPFYDPQEVHVSFRPAELVFDFPDHFPKPDFFLFAHSISQTFFGTILGFFVPPEPQPELVLLPPDHFVVPPHEVPVAFIEEVDENEVDIVENPLALIVFRRPVVVAEPPVLFEEPADFNEEVDDADIVDDPLALVVFERPLFERPPIVFGDPVLIEDGPVNVDALATFQGPAEVDDADIVGDPFALVVLQRRLFLEDERPIDNAPFHGLNPLAPAFVPAAHKIVNSPQPNLSSIPVFEAIQRARRRPGRFKAVFSAG
ncbi:hypothetical protein M413DRAFT_26826 [Hebeloma cylindrosporum]|uniref:Uncharacterized protein n=1 Tax=Hebeloma cylindrosporum TaxID=76867 RepID=A0A0C2YP76_HEBCY|nr:hypothetical protein M413DRAFT_26826 [Hebeloma cylindrosporum h7]